MLSRSHRSIPRHQVGRLRWLAMLAPFILLSGYIVYGFLGVRFRAPGFQRHRAIAHGLFAKPLADLVDGAIGAKARQAFFAAWPLLLVSKPERQVQLQLGTYLELRHRDRQQRDGLLASVGG